MHLTNWLQSLRSMNRRRRQQRDRSSSPIACHVNQLEPRLMLTVVADFDPASGKLDVQSSGSAETITITAAISVGIEYVKINGSDPLVDSVSTPVEAADVVTIKVAGTATGFSSISAIENVTGGTADDTLTDDVNDNVLDGQSGADALIGLAGDATCVISNDVTITIDETTLADTTDAGGSDTLSYSRFTSGVSVDLTSSAANVTFIDGSLSYLENVTGGAGGDSITGSTGDNILSGGAGADSLSGGDGNDTIDGGDGADTLDGLIRLMMAE